MLALQPCHTMVINPNVQLQQSKMFRVFDRRDAADVTPHRTVDSYKIEGYQTNNNPFFLKNMRMHGLCTWAGLVDPAIKTHALKTLQPIVRKLIAAYDEVDDEFSGIDQEALHIVRMPRIGRGKHNVHFDPLESPQHAALEKLAAASHFSEILSKYMGAPCTIRESGISITRPYQPNKQTQGTHSIQKENTEPDSKLDIETEDTAAGEGMEWHSDGPRGESTILMALEDVSPEQGSLMVIPGSHNVYVDGIGHTEVFLREHTAQLVDEQVAYNYRAGQPMIIDARTLHSVTPNVSDKWRVIVWFIFDSF